MPEPDQPHGAIDDFPELDPPFRTITSVAMACRTSVTWSARAFGRPAQSTASSHPCSANSTRVRGRGRAHRGGAAIGLLLPDLEPSDCGRRVAHAHVCEDRKSTRLN